MIEVRELVIRAVVSKGSRKKKEPKNPLDEKRLLDLMSKQIERQRER